MNTFFNLPRRRFLQYSSLGLAAFGLPSWLNAMEKIRPNVASANFHPDVELELAARPASVGVLPGTLTNVQKYFGKLLKGPTDTVTEIPGSYLGPILRFRTGQKVRIHFHNELDDPCITHWHGMHVPNMFDGHPMYAVEKGETWVYEFVVLNRAGMYFYHPHTHGMTGKQVYLGLAGLLFVEDAEEKQLNLPSGEYELPLAIQDRSFDKDNQLVYVTHNMQKMMGFHGDRILVNGKPDFVAEVASRAYRLRILNGSNARIYKLAWDDGSPITVIGVDGGLLEAPLQKPYVMMGPGERIDVWADFSGRAVGSELVMRSKPFSGALPAMHERMVSMMGNMNHGGDAGSNKPADGMDHGGAGMGMMGGGMGMMPGMKLPQGTDYPLFKIRVTRKASDSPTLPSKLATIKALSLKDVANPDKPVPIGISEGMMSMLLNGREFKMNDVQEFEKVKLNTIQLVEIFHAHDMKGGGAAGGEHGNEAAPKPSEGGMNHGGEQAQPQDGMNHGSSGGGMGMMGGMSMSMAHPIHLHGQQFQILSRSVEMKEEGYETMKDGFIDAGWKDVVLVMPGERIRILKPFQDYTGLFTYHCHNLEHEDLGMMRDFLVY